MTDLQHRALARVLRTVELMQAAQANRDPLLQWVHRTALYSQIGCLRFLEHAAGASQRVRRGMLAGIARHSETFERGARVAVVALIAVDWLAIAAFSQVHGLDFATRKGAAIHGLVANPSTCSGAGSSADESQRTCKAAERTGEQIYAGVGVDGDTLIDPAQPDPAVERACKRQYRMCAREVCGR